jgi:hypothetical protein
LWLIDNGSDVCPPKLIIYDLLYRNEEVKFLNKIPMKSSLKIPISDPISTPPNQQ